MGSSVDTGAAINPSNAEDTFIQSMMMQRFFENHLNPVMLVFIR